MSFETFYIVVIFSIPIALGILLLTLIVLDRLSADKHRQPSTSRTTPSPQRAAGTATDSDHTEGNTVGSNWGSQAAL